MATRVMCIVLILHVVSGYENYKNKNEGFMEHLNTGMKFAQNLLGSESVALKVADFVVRAFQPTSSPRRPAPATSGDDSSASEERPFEEKRPQTALHDAAPTAPTAPWRYLVRLLGLQPNQLSAVAVNALVFVAQMITSFLAGPRRPSKPHRSDDPAEWILNKSSKTLQDIIATAKNESLTDLVEELVAQHGDREETGCIRLLVCKITPFVSRMQEAVFGKPTANSSNKQTHVLYRHLPSQEEIRDRSDVCEKKVPDCPLNE